jgi:OOP family OmpA-OmpF porin
MRIIITFFLIFVALNISAQQIEYSSTNNKAIKWFEQAGFLLQERKFKEAIEYLKAAVEKDPDFIEAHMQLAFCYEILREIPKQEAQLKEVVRIAPDNPKYKNVYFTVARMYMRKGQYEKANTELAKLEKYGIDNPKLRQEGEMLRKSINFSMQNTEKRPIEPFALGSPINQYPLQYFPMITADDQLLIFTKRNGFTYSDHEDIYVSERQEDGGWGFPKSISPQINSPYNEGTCAISADGRTLIFTACEGRPTRGSCDLFISYKVGDAWSKPENLGVNINSDRWDSQPSLSADGRTLYFISNRPGGLGGRDIWMSQLDENDEWQPAINLGKPVNTPYDEVSPFIHHNGYELFYATKGHPGYGGFDLFKSTWNYKLWSEPENLGMPINNHEDQVSMFVNANGDQAFYSYEQKSDGRQSNSYLYSFKVPEASPLVASAFFIKGAIKDKETKEPLYAEIEIYDIDNNRRLASFHSDKVLGTYLATMQEKGNYALYVDSEGYLFESRNFSVKGFEQNIIQDFELSKIKMGQTTVLNNIFFKKDSYELTGSSEVELDKIVRFLNANPNTTMLIAGHTDSDGSESYNLDLSQKRAQAVYNYLIDNEIVQDRLIYKGFGETRPIAPNDTPSNKKLNRRIEFTVED